MIQRGDALVAQRDALFDKRDPEARGAGFECGDGHLECAVAIPVRLDDRAQRRGRRNLAQQPDVVPDGFEIDLGDGGTQRTPRLSLSRAR